MVKNHQNHVRVVFELPKVKLYQDANCLPKLSFDLPPTSKVKYFTLRHPKALLQ